MASMIEAFACPTSMAADLMKSKGFTRWQKSREAQFKVWTAVIGRLDNIVQAVSNQAKALSR
jgi:hypothetical protein